MVTRNSKDFDFELSVRTRPLLLGDGEGMQVQCRLRLSGQENFVNILQKELERLEL